VFNAIESLVDLDVERPESPPPASVHGSRIMENLSQVSGLGGLAAGDDSPAGVVADAAEPQPIAASVAVAEAAAADTPAPAAHDPAERSGGTDAVPAPWSPPADQARAEPEEAADHSLAALRAPGFVRQADRAARWRRPWVRAAMAGLVLAATGLLAWQVHWTHHDWLAARWPMLKPWVAQLCGWSGCRIQSPRFIDALVVESSGLVREPGSDSYRLAVSLRNRAAWPVRLPALDLVVTDAAGQVVSRRVLRAEDLGELATSVGPGAELPLAAVLRLRGAQVTGYTIELFYP
jgi:hypothetical protein